MTLTPAVRLGMEMLRLSPLELIERVRAEAEANPMLIVEERTGLIHPSGGMAEDVIARAVAAPQTLGAHLREQLSTMALPKEVRDLADYLTEALDERGFLTQSQAEIAAETGSPAVLVEAACEALTACEPAGVGAANLSECLSLQLQRGGMSASRAAQVVNAFEPLTLGDWPRAQGLLGGTLEELHALADTFCSLSINPASAFSDGPQIFLIPDLLVERQGNSVLQVTAYDRWMPRLSIDRSLLTKGKQDTRLRSFVEAQVQSGEALIRAVAFRGRTVEQLGQIIIETQTPFFLGRTDTPRPLTRQEAAVALGLNASTVGRALRGRALEFEGRVYPLDAFFQRRVGEGVAADVTAASIQLRLRQLVSREPRDKPYSDADLVHKLQDAGVDIARRTVAKYRDAMNIPPSHIRRRLAARLPRRSC